MKKMMITLLVCLTTATYTVNAQEKNAAKPPGAQGPVPPPVEAQQKAQESAEKAAKRYGLNEEQKNRWQGAAKERNMQRMGIKMQMQGETTPEQRKELRAQAKEQNDRFDRNVKEFLTADQYAKFTKDRQEHEKKRKEAAKKKKAENEKEISELEEH
jgi:hypothetical protein